jgi:hypothetical protein
VGGVKEWRVIVKRRIKKTISCPATDGRASQESTIGGIGFALMEATFFVLLRGQGVKQDDRKEWPFGRSESKHKGNSSACTKAKRERRHLPGWRLLWLSEQEDPGRDVWNVKENLIRSRCLHKCRPD